MTSENQPELFGEFNDLESKNKLFGKGILPEKTFTFTFSRDKLILIGLGFIVLLVVIFVLGFEQGKRKASIRRVIPAPALKTRQETQTAAREAKKPAAQSESKPYTIQVATFKSKELAQEEVSKLKKKGFSTTITIAATNGLYQIWIGEFSDQKEASQTLSVLKKIYKDCYIRKR